MLLRCFCLCFKCLKYLSWKNKNKNCPNNLNIYTTSIYQFWNGDLNKFILLLRKAVYLYEDMDIWEKSDQTTIPPKEAFYSKLILKDISDEYYAQVQKVWKAFGIKNRGEYHDLYVLCDTLLPADVFENLSVSKYMDLILHILKLA